VAIGVMLRTRVLIVRVGANAAAAGRRARHYHTLLFSIFWKTRPKQRTENSRAAPAFYRSADLTQRPFPSTLLSDDVDTTDDERGATALHCTALHSNSNDRTAILMLTLK